MRQGRVLPGPLPSREYRLGYRTTGEAAMWFLDADENAAVQRSRGVAMLQVTGDRLVRHLRSGGRVRPVPVPRTVVSQCRQSTSSSRRAAATQAARCATSPAVLIVAVEDL